MINRYVPEGSGYRRIIVDEPNLAPQTEIPVPSAPQETVATFQPTAQKSNAQAVVPQTGGSLRESLGSDLVLLFVLALALVDGDELDLVITLALILILGL